MNKKNNYKLRRKIPIGVEVKCLDCDCRGRLRTSGDRVYLFPEKVLARRNIHTQKADLKKPKSYKQKARERLKITKQ